MLEFLIFLCFSVLKQTKGKTRLTKNILGKTSPLAEASKSPATAPEKELDDVDHMFAGRPQEEGMMQQSSSFP